VQDACTLLFGGLLLLGARAGDIVGRRRLFMIGLGIFGSASLLIGPAPAGWWMIAARAQRRHEPGPAQQPAARAAA
jgi:MFS family permease